MESFWKTMRVFYGFVLRKRGWFFAFLFIVILADSLYAILPYFLKPFGDILAAGNYDKLLTLIIALVTIRFTSLFLSMLGFALGDVVIFDISINVRTLVFKHLQNLDFAFHADKSTGSLISAIKRGDSALEMLFQAIHHRVLEVFVRFVVMFIFLGALDIKVALITAASFVLSLVATKFLLSLNLRARLRHNEEEDKITGIIVDNLVNFETVKLFAKEKRETSRLRKAFEPWLSYGWQYANSFRVMDGTIGSIINLSILSILLVSLGMVQKASFTVGDFLLVVGFVSTVYPSLWELVYGLREIAKNYADVEKYLALLENVIQIKDPKRPIFLSGVKGAINYKNISFSYKDGKKNAVKKMSLNIPAGQSVALVGRSGSGKTTLIKLLLRFYDVDSGAITVDGVNIRKLTKSHLRSFMGVVPQEPVLFDNTIAYNIGYGRENVTRKDVVKAAKMANLHSFILSLPENYETNVGERGIKLSGGQKQRLAIARMILSDPDIIVFDEATSQLDSENETLIQDAFWKAAKGKTAIIIAHRLSTALRADRIIVMEDGSIVESGSHNSLLKKKKSLYKYFWNLQTNAS